MCQDCARLHEQLQEQSGEMFGLKRRIARLRAELKEERLTNAKILKEVKKNRKPPLRKGQKRSHFGRN